MAEARQTVDARASQFEEKSGNPASFRDPDFLSALQAGQESFVKTDNNLKHKMLVDLVVRRSTLESGNRRAYLINEAIIKAALLSQEEISLLSILFTLNRVRSTDVIRASEFEDSIIYLKNIISLVQNLDASVDYLISLGIINRINKYEKFDELVKRKYPVIWKKAVNKTESENMLGDLKPIGPIFRYVKNDFEICNGQYEEAAKDVAGSVLLAPNAIDQELFEIDCLNANLSKDDAISIWNSFGDISGDPLSYIYSNCSWIKDLKLMYDGENLSSLAINSLGIAIVHAFLEGEHGFDAPLSAWLK